MNDEDQALLDATLADAGRAPGDSYLDQIDRAREARKYAPLESAA